jgi:hypothetical protein
MNKQFICLAGILILAIMAVAVAASAQDPSAAANNGTLNNTTLNGTTTDSAAAALDLDLKGHGALNLSTIKDQTVTAVPISEVAGVAPLVAAGASSAQVASEPANSHKIGSGVASIEGHLEQAEAGPLSLDIATKPMRDTGKMFFVCDLV